MGLPVFSATGAGGVAHMLGPTGGFICGPSLVAGVAGWIVERGLRICAQPGSRTWPSDPVRGGLGWLAVMTYRCSLLTLVLLPLWLCTFRSDRGRRSRYSLARLVLDE